MFIFKNKIILYRQCDWQCIYNYNFTKKKNFKLPTELQNISYRYEVVAHFMKVI